MMFSLSCHVWVQRIQLSIRVSFYMLTSKAEGRRKQHQEVQSFQIHAEFPWVSSTSKLNVYVVSTISYCKRTCQILMSIPFEDYWGKQRLLVPRRLSRVVWAGGFLRFVFSNSQQWHSPTMLDAVLAQWAAAIFLNVMKTQATAYSLNKPDHIRIQSYVQKQRVAMWLYNRSCRALPWTAKNLVTQAVAQASIRMAVIIRQWLQTWFGRCLAVTFLQQMKANGRTTIKVYRYRWRSRVLASLFHNLEPNTHWNWTFGSWAIPQHLRVRVQSCVRLCETTLDKLRLITFGTLLLPFFRRHVLLGCAALLVSDCCGWRTNSWSYVFTCYQSWIY